MKRRFSGIAARALSERGVALIVTVMVVTLLTAIIVEFSYRTRVYLDTSGNTRDELQAYYLAKAGVEAAKAFLLDDLKSDIKNGTAADYIISGEFNPVEELWSQVKGIPFMVPDVGVIEGEVIDEDSKFCINMLAEKDPMGTKYREQAKLLFSYLIKEENYEEIVDNIKDWIDPDSDGNAEDGYYRSLQNPYNCRNSPMNSVDELRMIKGINEKIFNKLRDFVTPYGDGKININTAGQEVLMSLDAQVTGEMASQVITDRTESPFKDRSDPRIPIGFKNSTLWDVQTSYFTIISKGSTLGNVSKIIICTLKRDRGTQEIKKLLFWKSM